MTGFEAFKAFRTPLLADTIRTKLTQSLKWRSANLHADCLYIISRLASLVFIGPELCRRDDWLEVAGVWTHHVVAASLGLRAWPWFLRPLVNIFQPASRVLRQSTAKARGIIEPVVAKRREERLRNAKDGKLPRPADSIGWLDDVAKGEKYDFTVYQLALTGAAMHTTTMLLAHAILDICAHPEYVEPLREEIRSAVQEEGWKKTALYKMKLMDSFLKESQRVNPITV
ncbi:Cytochrome P450 monooxygenase pyr3, partial [Lasiodiplodia theobromae]